MRKVIAALFALSTVSAFAATPTQQVLDEVNKVCAVQPNYDNSYRLCNTLDVRFPFENDAAFKNKLTSVLKKSGLKIKGDPVSSIKSSVPGFSILNGSVIHAYASTYNQDYDFALIDKAGNQYGMSVYYAPYGNKLIVEPTSQDTSKYSHPWLGDLKDATLRKGIVQFVRNNYKSSWGSSPNAQNTFKDTINEELRELKIYLGADIQHQGFQYYDPNYRLPHEKK